MDASKKATIANANREVKRLEGMLDYLVKEQRWSDARLVHEALHEARREQQLAIMPEHRARRLRQKAVVQEEKDEFFRLIRLGLRPKVPACLRSGGRETGTLVTRRGHAGPGIIEHR